MGCVYTLHFAQPSKSCNALRKLHQIGFAYCPLPTDDEDWRLPTRDWLLKTGSWRLAPGDWLLLVLHNYNFLHHIPLPDLVDDVEAVEYLSEDGVVAVQVFCIFPVMTDKEL